MSSSRYSTYVARGGKSGDSIRLDASTHATIHSIQGDRSEQEERIATTRLEAFKQLTPKDQEKILHKTVKKMQQKYASEELKRNYLPKDLDKVGSSLVNATAWLDETSVHAICAHLGDSEAYLIITSKHEPVKVECLTKVLHHPSVWTERQRIEERGGNIINGKIAGRVKVSRAIGDNASLGELDHKADINLLHLPLFKEQKAYLLLVSAGFRTNIPEKMSSEELIKKTVRYDYSPEKLANILVTLSYDLGSKHNITVCVLPIVSKTPVSAALFDGHGGSEIANGLEQDYFKQLKLEIEKKFDKQYPFVVAAGKGNIDIVKMLFPSIDDINLAAIGGETALITAAAKGHLEMVNLLLTLGADANAGTDAKPLHLAAMQGHKEVVRALLNHDAEIDFAIANGSTPLFLAIKNKHIKVAEYLVRKGASLLSHNLLSFKSLIKFLSARKEVSGSIEDRSIATAMRICEGLGETKLRELGYFDRLEEIKSSLFVSHLAAAFKRQETHPVFITKSINQLLKSNAPEDAYASFCRNVGNISLTDDTLFKARYTLMQKELIQQLKSYFRPLMPEQNVTDYLLDLQSKFMDTTLQPPRNAL